MACLCHRHFLLFQQIAFAVLFGLQKQHVLTPQHFSIIDTRNSAIPGSVASLKSYPRDQPRADATPCPRGWE